MKEIEKTKEFIEHLADAEEMVFENVQGLNNECPIGVAKKKIIGLEKNCKIIKLDPSYLTENPYIKNIHIGNWVVGDICLNNFDCYKENATYNYNARKRDLKSLTTIYEVCYFPKKMYYPSIGTILTGEKWMGVEPAEMNTFASFIEEASGKVLLMGCGLGYVAYMLSLKKDVNEITIVELDPNIKKMFEIYLKPQMNNKINIVKGDAIEFLAKENIATYQYCSVDIWHGLMDMFPIYLKCLLLEQRHPQTKFHYWLEDDLHRTLESAWIILMKKAINKNSSENKKEILTDILNNQNIETIEDVRNFITAPKRPIIKDWALQNYEDEGNYEDRLARKLERVRKENI